MANTFKSASSASIGTTPVTVYTVPTSTTSIIMGLNIANVTGGQVLVTVEVGSIKYVKDAPIPAGAALSVIDGKLVMEAANTLKVTCNTASAVDALASLMEIT